MVAWVQGWSRSQWAVVTLPMVLCMTVLQKVFYLQTHLLFFCTAPNKRIPTLATWCSSSIPTGSQTFAAQRNWSFLSPFAKLCANGLRCPVLFAAVARQKAINEDGSIQQLVALPKIGRRNGESIDNLNIVAWWWESEI